MGLKAAEELGFLTRGMLEADLELVVDIERRSFSIPWTTRMFLSELRHEMSWARVLLDPDGEVGGYLIARFHGDLWHVMDVALREELRGRGLAAALLDEFLDVTSTTGAEYTLEVRPSNEPAQTLYRSRGFAEVGRRPGYYHDNHEDAIIMVRKSLLEPAAAGAPQPNGDGGGPPGAIAGDAR